MARKKAQQLVTEEPKQEIEVTQEAEKIEDTQNIAVAEETQTQEKELITATTFIDDVKEKEVLKREKEEQKKLKKINKQNKKAEKKRIRAEREAEIDAMDLNKENSFCEQNYIAISQTDLIVNDLAKSKRMQMLMIKEAESDIEDTDLATKQIGDANLGLITSFINAVLGSFFFGFFVHFVSSIVQALFINKVQLGAEGFKKIFVKSLKCGLVSLIFGVLVIIVVLFFCIYNRELFTDPNAIITLRYIAFLSAIALSVIVNFIMYYAKLKSFKYALICFMKSMPALILYVIFVGLTTLLLSIVPAIVAAILAKLALRNIFNTEIYEEEKKENAKQTTKKTTKTIKK